MTNGILNPASWCGQPTTLHLQAHIGFWSPLTLSAVHAGSPSCGGDVTNRACPLLFYTVLVSVSVFFGPFNCISFYKFSQQLSVFSLCSSGLISLPCWFFQLHVSLWQSPISPDVIPSGWLGSRHQLTNWLTHSLSTRHTITCAMRRLPNMAACMVAKINKQRVT